MTEAPPIPVERQKILTRIRRLYNLGKNQKHTPEGKSSLKEARRLRRLHHVRDEELQTGIKLLHEAFSKRYAKMTFEVIAAMMDVTPTWEGRTAHIEGTDSATYDRIYAAFCEAWLWLEPRVEAIIRAERHRPLVVWESVHVGLVDQASALGMKPAKKEDPPSGPVNGTISGPDAETLKQLPDDAGPTPPPPTPTASEPGTSTSTPDPLSTFSVSGYGLGAECPGLETLFPNRIETDMPPEPPPATSYAKSPSFRSAPSYDPFLRPPPPPSVYRNTAPFTPPSGSPSTPPREDLYLLEVQYNAMGKVYTFGPSPLTEVNNLGSDATKGRAVHSWVLKKNGVYFRSGYDESSLNRTVAEQLRQAIPSSSVHSPSPPLSAPSPEPPSPSFWGRWNPFRR